MALAPIPSKSEAPSWLGPGATLLHHTSTSPPIVETRGSSLNSPETGHIQTCILPILAIGIHPPPSTRNRNHDCTIRALDHAPPVACVSPSSTPTPLFPILAYRRSQYDGPSTTVPAWFPHDETHKSQRSAARRNSSHEGLPRTIKTDSTTAEQGNDPTPPQRLFFPSSGSFL